jgi:hypothetical protein
MNPDVFITIVFVGIAVLAALAALVFVVPQIRRDEMRVSRRASRLPPGAAEGSDQ